MPNAKDYKQSERQSILAVGEVGSGKTTQILTLPGKKFVYIFDPNALASLAGADLDYEEFVVEAMDLDLAVKTLKKDVGDRASVKAIPKTYIKWEQDFEKRLSSGFFEDYDWICIDSFTTFSDSLMDRAQYLSGRLGKQPEQADYAVQVQTMRNIFRALHGTGKNIYCTGHVDLRQDELSKRVHNQLMMTGRLRTTIPLLFTQVLFFEAESTRSGPAYRIQTFPNRENPKIRCTFKSVGTYEDVTIDWKKDPLGQGLARFL